MSLIKPRSPHQRTILGQIAYSDCHGCYISEVTMSIVYRARTVKRLNEFRMRWHSPQVLQFRAYCAFRPHLWTRMTKRAAIRITGQKRPLHSAISTRRKTTFGVPSKRTQGVGAAAQSLRHIPLIQPVPVIRASPVFGPRTSGDSPNVARPSCAPALCHNNLR